MLTITTNANNGSPNFTIPLTMGAQGVIVTNNLVTTTWAFPSVRVGRQSDFVVGINNSGNAPLEVTLTGLAAGVFSLAANPITETMTPGSTQVTAYFAPTSQPGNFADSATLTVTPAAGYTFCGPLPASWQTPTINFTGTSP
jgi:hypothetical protein